MSWSNKFLIRESIADLRSHFPDAGKLIWKDEPISRDVPLREDGVNEQNVPSRNGRDTLCETTTVSAFFEQFKEDSFEQLNDEQKMGILAYVQRKER